MRTSTSFSSFARGALALVLIGGLFPTLALAEEPTDSSVVSDFVAKSEEAYARFAATGNAYDLRDVSAYESDSNIMTLSNDQLPLTFDLRASDLVTPVKLQNPWGTCWSFAAIAACETSILAEKGWKASEHPLDLSELHTAWFPYTPLPDGPQKGEGFHPKSTEPQDILDLGGYPLTATSVFSSGIGPVPEDLAPYHNANSDITYIEVPGMGNMAVNYSPDGDWSVAEELRFVQTYELEESSILPSPAGKNEDGTYRYNPAGTTAIKQELQAGRAVEIGFTADTSMPDQLGDKGNYIDQTNWAHYTYDENSEVNHAVTIVGWDDTYSKSNFLKNHQPKNDGAWIVKNSWGAKNNDFPHKSTWGIDGSGYFYLSYEDKSISIPESFNFYTEEDQAVDYFIHQYDYLPSEGITSVSKDQPASMANVFDSEDTQRIRSLSCETSKPNTKVTYDLYLLNDEYTNPEDGERVRSVTEEYSYGGYHRIELDKSVLVEPGQSFSVVITEQCGSTYEVLADRSPNKTGAELTGAEYYSVGVVNKGESYLKSNSTWTDWRVRVDEIKEQATASPSGDIFDYDNFPIKAYANPAFVVPDLSNMTEADALSALEDAGLCGIAGTAEYSDTTPAGYVIRQDIAAGTEVTDGVSVTYILSLGKDPATALPLVTDTKKPPTTGGTKLAPTGDATASAAVAAGVVAIALSVACGAALRYRRKRRMLQ